MKKATATATATATPPALKVGQVWKSATGNRWKIIQIDQAGEYATVRRNEKEGNWTWRIESITLAGMTLEK